MRRCCLYESGNRHSPSSWRLRRPALRLQIGHGKNRLRYIHVCGPSGSPETGVAEEIIKMHLCDVLDCPNFAVTQVSAPGVEGEYLNICDEHLADIEAGVQYAVD